MSSMQHRLSDCLQYEMYHVLGAYGVAERKLEGLERRLRKSDPDAAETASREDGQSEGNQDAILRLASRTRAYNAALGVSRHRRTADLRHPIPADLPLTRHERFDLDRDPAELEGIRASPWKGPRESSWVLNFYDTAIHVLRAGHGAHKSFCTCRACTLAENLLSLRDGLASGSTDVVRDRRHRRERYEMRRKLAHEHLGESDLRPEAIDSAGASGAGHEKATDKRMADRLGDLVMRVASSHLGLDSEGSLPFFVLNAQLEAHLAMHAVEAWQTMPLGDYAELVAGKRKWLNEELDRCIALSTFVYCVGRSAPWIFAEDDEECEYVFENFAHCWRNVVPTRCMWLASQFAMLALHRRAYARALKGDPTGAYNDYHKLQRQIRDMRRRIQSAPIHVEGAHAFLFGLEAQAHYHIGELYRSEHAHKPAVKHLRSASHGLRLLSREHGMREVLINSRWNVQLQISQGKASYELGHHKEGLCWHLRGWRQFLALLAADTGTTANVEETTKAIEWLEEVRFEPELLKSEVQRYIAPVVEQLEGIEVVDHLGALAADILLRLGHLLFVLNIGREPEPPELVRVPGSPVERERAARQEAERRISRTLGFSCLAKAAQCDRRNTLAGADVLKGRLRMRAWFGGTLPLAYDRALTPHELDPVAHQWPGGSDDYENLARVAEYLMLRAQLHDSTKRREEAEEKLSPDMREEADISRDLLMFFFMHTDSINVRKSQVHKFLMRERKPTRLRDHPRGPEIEFICMRRYSSAFPLLPRPSTFRALGGGYFMRLHGRLALGKKPPDPFGIIIDPGVDFIENLYRTGYSLSDVDMVLITHDHVDHLGSLDPFLSLLYEHSHYRSKQRTASGVDDQPIIYASQSVINRYLRVVVAQKTCKFLPLSGFVSNPGEPKEAKNWPRGFELVAMSSEELNGEGHLDLSNEPALGICIRVPRGPSIAITGDTPAPPAKRDDPSRLDTPDRYRKWRKEWRQALSADVLVCHLSTVPLTELRKMSKINAEDQPLREEDRCRIRDLASKLAANAREVLAGGESKALEPFEGDLRGIQEKAADIASKAEDANVFVGEVDALTGEIHNTVNSIVEKLESEAPPDLPRYIYDAVDEANVLIEIVKEAPHDTQSLGRVRRELQTHEPRLKGQVEFGLWLGSHRPLGDESERSADLLKAVSDRWLPPPQHSYLTGVIRWAREYERERRRRGWDAGLLVVGELSEELGTVRSKVAMQLNTKVFAHDGDRGPGQRNGKGRIPERTFSALTGDIGLQIMAGLPPSGSDANGARVDARVLCTICDLDTDRVPGECFHPAHRIHEVCVKGENEGIFYNCTEHNPSTQEDPVFLEQLERFDIFGR